MTGRDLIIYILQNGLEDANVLEDDRILGFMTVEEAALYFEVGYETVRSWILLKRLEAVWFNDRYYIPSNAKLLSPEQVDVHV